MATQTQTPQPNQVQINGIEGIIIERKKEFKKLPKVFVEGYSSVKISLVKDFVNCREYTFPFEGCFIFENDELRPARGIFYVPNRYFLEIYSKSFANSRKEAKEAILEQVKFVNRYIKPKRGKLLIDFNFNYHMRIYDGVIEGMQIKFPLKAQQGNLYVIEVPPLPSTVELKNDLYEGVRVYNHEIHFNKEVTVYQIEFKFNGYATLVYNNNNETVEARLSSPDHEDKVITLESGKTYLFSHPEPQEDTD